MGKPPMDIPVKAELNKFTYRLVLDGHEELVVSVPVSSKDKDADVVREFELKPKRIVKRPTSKPKPKAQPKDDPKPKPDKPKVKLLTDGPKEDVKRIK